MFELPTFCFGRNHEALPQVWKNVCRIVFGQSVGMPYDVSLRAQRFPSQRWVSICLLRCPTFYGHAYLWNGQSVGIPKMPSHHLVLWTQIWEWRMRVSTVVLRLRLLHVLTSLTRKNAVVTSRSEWVARWLCSTMDLVRTVRFILQFPKKMPKNEENLLK